MNLLLVGYDVYDLGWDYSDLSIGAESGEEPKGVEAELKGLEACENSQHHK